MRDILLPLDQEGYVAHNNRGLPIIPINQLFTALTFFATGEFQVRYKRSSLYRVIIAITGAIPIYSKTNFD